MHPLRRLHHCFDAIVSVAKQDHVIRILGLLQLFYSSYEQFVLLIVEKCGVIVEIPASLIAEFFYNYSTNTRFSICTVYPYLSKSLIYRRIWRRLRTMLA
jgi:hypothetical protein